MNPAEEIAKRRDRAMGQIGELTYERFGLARVIEANRKRVADIDALIGEAEAVLKEQDQAARDFDTYMAIENGAMTLDQLGKTINEGGEPEAGTKVVPFAPNESEAQNA